jgi:hypothetical protein
MSYRMYVYWGRKLLAVETNKEFAIPYWTERKRMNKRITWRETYEEV